MSATQRRRQTTQVSYPSLGFDRVHTLTVRFFGIPVGEVPSGMPLKKEDKEEKHGQQLAEAIAANLPRHRIEDSAVRPGVTDHGQVVLDLEHVGCANLAETLARRGYNLVRSEYETKRVFVRAAGHHKTFATIDFVFELEAPAPENMSVLLGWFARFAPRSYAKCTLWDNPSRKATANFRDREAGLPQRSLVVKTGITAAER